MKTRLTSSVTRLFAGAAMLGIAGCTTAPAADYNTGPRGGYYGNGGVIGQPYNSGIEVETVRDARDVCVPGTMRVYARQESFDRDAYGNFIYDQYGRRRFTAITTYSCLRRDTYQPYYYGPNY